MKYAATLIFLLLSESSTAADALPPNISREPNCVVNTICLCENETYTTIPESLPAGFSRAPNCDQTSICVSEKLFMVPEDFIAIRVLIESDFGTQNLIIRNINQIMTGIVHVEAFAPDIGVSSSGGAEYVVENQGNHWKIIRRSLWVA